VITRILPIALGLSWGLLVFWIGLVLTFPSDAVSERIAWEVDQATKGGMVLRLDGVSPSWGVTGVNLEGAQLLQRVEGKGDEEDTVTLLVQAIRVDARARILPLLTGDLITDLDAELYDGTLAGELGQVDGSLTADLVANDLDLSLYPFAGADWSVDASGLLDALVDLTVSPDDVKEAKGDLEVSVDGLVLRDLVVSGFTIEEAVFSEAVLELDVRDGEADVEKGEFISDMVEATVEGKIILSSPLERSRLKLDLKVRLDEDLDQLAQIAPGMKNARDEGGTYHFMVSGTLERPRFREDRLAARKRGAPATRRDEGSPATARPPLRLDSEGELDEEAEERRRLREERIAERRERMRKSRDEQREAYQEGDPQVGSNDRDREPPPEMDGLPRPGFDDERGFDDPRERDPRRDDEEYLDDLPPEDDLPREDDVELEFEDGERRELGYVE